MPQALTMPLTTPWATSRATSDYLQVSEKTLYRWRHEGFLKSGVHYRRKFPAANSPLLYNLELCERATTEAFARDHQILELAD
jgi:predicted site-specific integrase-resolvase